MPGENIKTRVIDASFVLAYLMPDERVGAVDGVFESYAQGSLDFLSSAILPLEVVNGLKYALGKRINKETAIKLVDDFLLIEITLVDSNIQEVFKVSVKNNLSVYDASYVHLAREKDIPLLTLDERLKQLA